MKRLFKKSLALLLALTMVFGAAPLAGLVGLELPSLKDVFAEKAEAATYGNLIYEIFNGKVIITDCNTSASGDLVIPETIEGCPVTSIGYEAFYKCTGLTSITIPDSVTSIDRYAFEDCTGLTSITVDVNNPNYSSDEYGVLFYKDKYNLIQYPIGNKRTEYIIPDSVRIIGKYAFKGCTGMTSITIPDSVTSIGEGAFAGCTGLTSVTIPDSVTSMGNGAFSGCGLTSITIPDSVTSIGNYAFYDCTGLTSITIPDSVTRIGSSAFSYCTGLTSVTIPDGVTSIGGSAFYNTGIYNDSSNWENGVLYIGNYLIEADPTISGKYLIKPGIKVLADHAFSGCTELTSITIPDSVTSIGDYAFKGCTGLTRVTIGNGVTSIGLYAFYDCDGLTSITIPDSVTSIGGGAFDGCNNLSTTYYVGTLEQWRDIWIGSFNDPINRNIIFECNSERPNYGKGACGDNLSWTLYTDGELVIDGTGDMKDYSSDSNVPWNSKRSIIKSATIPDSVTSIGKYAFKGCTGLTSVTIPDGVTSIGDYAFDGCNNLSTTYYVGTPEQWRDISISHSNDPIKKNIIFECNSERPYYQGTCGENLTWTLYTDGELVIDGTGDMTDYSSSSNAPWYSKRSKIKSATILDGVTSIGNYAFYNCTGLTSITIPDSVTFIGRGAFYNCTGLTSVKIPDSVTSIGDYAFYGCTNLEKIEISAYSVEISDNAFDNSSRAILYCKSGSTVQSYAELNDIMYILIDDPASGFTVKNNQLVAYKGESENPQIPSGVTSIGSNAFKDNGTVKTVELPNSVSLIFSGAFSNCSSLERIVVPHTVTTIAPDAFNGTNATIVCYANSYAHQYAVEKGMNFELISITLNQTKVILSVGEYSIITATPEQEYLDSVQTSWKSSDTGVATVDANGKVTALSNGTATIYALAPTGETLATCSVQVGYSFRITIQNPSTKTISYKSGIILHATADNLPAGAKIVWEKDNDNFSMSDDGNGNCKIISKANGSTTFTAKVKLADGSIAKDSNGNEISAQVTMNSKAGFFDKIVAFFKGLFGGNKVLPQLFKGIF